MIVVAEVCWLNGCACDYIYEQQANHLFHYTGTTLMISWTHSLQQEISEVCFTHILENRWKEMKQTILWVSFDCNYLYLQNSKKNNWVVNETRNSISHKSRCWDLHKLKTGFSHLERFFCWEDSFVHWIIWKALHNYDNHDAEMELLLIWYWNKTEKWVNSARRNVDAPFLFGYSNHGGISIRRRLAPSFFVLTETRTTASIAFQFHSIHILLGA